MLSKYLILPFLLSCMLLHAACKKGDTGPAGTPGSANVLYSSWKATNPWVASSSSSGSGKNTFYFDFFSTDLTAGIIDSGTVLVYAKFVSDPDSTGIVKQLPSIYYNLGGTSTEYRFQSGLFPGKIRIICDVLPAGSPSNSNMVRYVIIPGGKKSSFKGTGAALSYEAVCAHYGIPE